MNKRREEDDYILNNMTKLSESKKGGVRFRIFQFVKRHKKILGGFLVLVGVAGLFIPFLQGIILIVIGSTLFFGEDNRFVQKILGLLKQWKN